MPLRIGLRARAGRWRRRSGSGGLALGVVRPGRARQAQVGPGGSRRGARGPGGRRPAGVAPRGCGPAGRCPRRGSPRGVAPRGARPRARLALAADAQLAASKTGEPVAGVGHDEPRQAPCSGSAGLSSSIDLPALTSPTPFGHIRRLRRAASRRSMQRALDLVRRQVDGCLPRISAAMPLTTGAANDVPESSM